MTTVVLEAAAVWPAADVMVLRARPLRAGARPENLPRFGDDIWHLQAAHPDVHAVAATLCWGPFPEPLTLAFKAFALAALERPYPVDPVRARSSDQPAVTTISLWVRDLRVFACWLHDRSISRLCDVTLADLDAYHRHVSALACSADRQRHLLVALRALWSYGAYLPPVARLVPEPPDASQPAGRHRGPVNKTPRIAEATMERLLAWSLTMVEDIGTDILAAQRDFQQLEAGTHPSQAALAHLGPTGRVRAFVAQARRDHTLLPRHPGEGPPTVNWCHLNRVLHLPRSTLGRADLRLVVTSSGLELGSDSFVGKVTAQVDGRTWRDRPITLAELPTMLRLLSAACFVTISYLSGARPGEVLNLRRGCASRDAATGELLVYGRLGKGPGRLPAREGEPSPRRPWVVVAPVHHAIAVLEQVTRGELLFPASLARPGSRRSADEQARGAHHLSVDIEDFIAWVNHNFPGPDNTPAIPPDPAGHIHASRFRRTLAYFIVRRPRGLIAAALQYGHVHTKVTLGYSGMADTSWLDDLAVERLEMVLEQADADARLLSEGEHVSGPAATEYKTRVRQAAHFAGRTITQVRNVQRLLASADPAIYHGDGMTCVWRPETALCRKARTDQGLPHNDIPEQSECRSTCANLAYTDRDISQVHDRHHALTAAATDQLAPQPLRDRAQAIADQLVAIIGRHERARPSMQPCHPNDCEDDEPPAP